MSRLGVPRVFPRNRITIFLIAIAGALILYSLWNIASTTTLGGGDFWGYWSATYLLRNGQNPYDPQAIALVQTTQMDTGLDFTIMSVESTISICSYPAAYVASHYNRKIYLAHH